MTKIPSGIQLYTVRNECEKDFAGTLKAVAEMGYQGVEFAWNYGGMSPEELAAFLKELGLSACGLHVPIEQALDGESEAYAYAKAIGAPYIITSLPAEVEKDWYAAIEQVKKAGEIARAQGVTFTYHHHAQEFQKIDGEYALDLLYKKTDPQAVLVELDTYWLTLGGVDPVKYIRKYAGRVRLLHLKDMNAADRSFAEVGTGLMDLPAIFDAAQDVGIQWIIVEQDVCKGPAIESARISIENLKETNLAA